MGNVSDALTHAHTVATVGNTSTKVLDANAMRRYALLVNDSDEVIYVSIDGTAAAQNDGIRLNASGGSLALSMSAGNLTQGGLYAICASGNKKLLVTEGV